jgi:hypothetical protein
MSKYQIGDRFILPDTDDQDEPILSEVVIVAIRADGNYIATKGYYTVGEDVIDASRKKFGNPEEPPCTPKT